MHLLGAETGLSDPWLGTSLRTERETLVLCCCLLEQGSYFLHRHKKKSLSVVSSEHEWLKFIRIWEGTLQSC